MTTISDRKAFTLVELLSVIVIIGFVLSIGIPAMLRISQSNALTAGTRQFSDQVAMARTFALTSGSNVYLLVARDINATNYGFVAYGFCVSAVNALLSANPLAQVTYVDNVQYLPQGAVFSNGALNASTTLTNAPFPTSTSSNVTVWVVKLNRFGQISPLTVSPTFYIMQGYVDASGSPQAAGSSINEVAINPLTGKARVTRR